MTTAKMKQSSLELISQIDDSDKELMEKIWIFLSTNIEQPKPSVRQQSRVAKVRKYAGAFAACQTEDWKKEKETYLQEVAVEPSSARSILIETQPSGYKVSLR